MAASPRRDGIDVARVLALLVVVAGHLTIAVVDRPADDVRGANLLELYPGWAWLAAAAPMPVFFAAGGWANATASPDRAAARLRTLVGLAAVVVAVWSAAVLVAVVTTGEPGVLSQGARIATQPVWFLAAYVPFAAAGGWLARQAARSVRRTVGGCLALLLVLDLARFGLDGPGWIGWPGFFLAWGTPWLLGAWWRRRADDPGFRERRTGLALAAGGAVAAAGLAVLAGYQASLIDAVPGGRSNTTPPTLYTAVAAVAQTGVLMAGAAALDRAGRRWRRLWDRAGAAAVGIYLWHLTALALCGALVAAGLPVPDRLTAAWWLTRPLWWAAVLGLTAGFVAATAAARSRLARGERPGPGSARTAAGVAVTAGAAALTALEGPTTALLAAACGGLFVLAWLLLRGQR